MMEMTAMQIAVKMAMQLLLAFTGTVAFSVLFSVPAKHFFYCGLTGSVGWGVYLIINGCYHTPVMAMFAATLILTSLSRYLSVKRKAPTPVFLLCGIFTLVPGSGIYYTAYSIFMDAGKEALENGIGTMKLAVAIALGIGAAYSIPSKVFGWKNEAEVWKKPNPQELKEKQQN